MESESVIVIPFSKVLATMILMKENDNWSVTNLEIINFDSMISSSNKDIEVSVEDDDESFLECCLEHDDSYNFTIKSGCTYDTILDNGLTVRDFLRNNSLSQDFLTVLLKDYESINDSSKNLVDIKVIKDKKRRFKRLIRSKDKSMISAR